MKPPSLPPVLLRAARTASDWVDLQWSLLWEVIAAVAPRARGRLLDVGCGQRPYEELFRPYVTEYVGIEHDATFHHTNASTHEKRPDLYYDGRTLPFEDGSFDTVINIQVLEHTPDPRNLVHEMSRVLKDDGLLILSAPFEFRLHEQPYDYFRYTPHGLRVLCQDAGLEVFEVLKQGSLWSVVAHKINSYLAFQVARIGGLAQAMGKLSHEASAQPPSRVWTLPLVAPLMVGLSGGARVMDRFFEDPDESLGFLILARRRTRHAA
jgi:SAM-dependent methyltransferase